MEVRQEQPAAAGRNEPWPWVPSTRSLVAHLERLRFPELFDQGCL
jgi:hypothetical protein